MNTSRKSKWGMILLNKMNVKSFLRPDSRKITIFLAILACIIAILVSGPSLFPVGSSSTIVVVPQIVLGVFLAIVTVPFTIVATVFRAFGIDLFYTVGTAANAAIGIAVMATISWWYTIACLMVFLHHRFKGGRSRLEGAV